VVIAFWSYCYILFAWNNWWSPLQITLPPILSVRWIFCFQNSSTEHYKYPSKAAVIKLSFWVRWHIMLLICCRLQQLDVSFWSKLKDRGLLEGIGSLHELTSLCLSGGSNLTAQASSTFLHWPSMASIVFFNLAECFSLDDERLKGASKRCNKLTYLHV